MGFIFIAFVSAEKKKTTTTGPTPTGITARRAGTRRYERIHTGLRLRKHYYRRHDDAATVQK